VTVRRVRIAGLVLTVAGALAAGGLALRASASSAVHGVREVRIVIHHSRYEPADVQVAPDERVRFVLVNTDPIDHEFIVGDARVQLAHERGTEAHHAPRPGEITVPAGATRFTTVTFPRSSEATMFGCHLPGHYAFGMVGTLRIG
jgi:uncharacterized cupredoxin-like copper-binding protein